MDAFYLDAFAFEFMGLAMVALCLVVLALPSGRRLPPEWALQVPQDYVEVLQYAVPAAVRDAGIDPGQVIGIATDFTACTVLPTTEDGTPLCELLRSPNVPMPTSSSGGIMPPNRRRTASTALRQNGRNRGCRATAD